MNTFSSLGNVPKTVVVILMDKMPVKKNEDRNPILVYKVLITFWVSLSHLAF